MSTDIILHRRSVEIVGGPVEVKDNLEVEGELTANESASVRGHLSTDSLSVGGDQLQLVTRSGHRIVSVRADQVHLLGPGTLSAGDTRTRSLTTPSIETSGIVLGVPAGEEGVGQDDQPSVGPIRPRVPDIEPNIPDPVLPDPPPPDPFSPGATSLLAPQDLLLPQGPTAGRITLRDAEGDNTIVLDAASGRVTIKGIGDLLAKIEELEARIAELEG